MKSFALSIFCATILLALGADPVCRRMELSSIDFKLNRQTVANAFKVVSMELMRQISNSPCTYPASFGYVGPDVFVSNGCRGEFNVCYEQGKTVRLICESRSFRPASCFAGYNILYLLLVKQISGSPCVENQTFYYQGAYVHVSSGCRGEFIAGVQS